MPDRFSVAMCTYGGARFAGAQLASIAAQTRPPDELVVCDDRSPDETARLVEEFAAAAPFPVRLHVNERNLGSTKNFGRAISLCEGDLIALCDQDDVWEPGKLAKLEAEFARRPSVGLVFSDAEVVDEGLRPLGRGLWEKVGFDRRMQRLVSAGRALDVLLPGWTVMGATMAFRAAYRELFLEIPEDLGMIHDAWIALVIAAVSDVAFIEERLVKYRQHPRQQLGAPDLGPAAPERLARRGADDYDRLIRAARRLRERLARGGADFDLGGALAGLDARLTHMEARAGLPRARLRRAPVVFRELFAMRYHQFSNGLAGAARDLLL
jgi:glycosyltransferase involved in cell wall biosynthesis